MEKRGYVSNVLQRHAEFISASLNSLFIFWFHGKCDRKT